MDGAATPRPDGNPAGIAPAGSGGRPLPVIDSERLFDGHTEIRIRHRGEEYRLRITRQGKLILTK
jgi:hemin uptake protein HemP